MARKGKKKDPEPVPYRCPRCDSIVPDESERCVMCGLLREDYRPDPDTANATPSVLGEDSPANIQVPIVVEDDSHSVMESDTTNFEGLVQETRSSVLFWVIAAIVIAGLGAGWLVLRDEAPAVMAAFIPTTTPLPPTITNTPTWTPIPSETPLPTDTPGPTDTPVPTATPRDPRFHTVVAGETLFGLSLLYRISAESIAQTNEFDINAPIQSGQNLIIPWPTATPPLESVLIEINGEQVLADATNCEIITIQSGDSAYGLSAVKGVPLEAIIAINRQTQESIQLLQPGDTLCIPKLLYGDTIPPTAGPSPTPSLTPPPAGPSLLYPIEGWVAEDIGTPVVLQWTAVKDLEESEWYMVEMRDAEDRDSLPLRGFTRDQSFRLPDNWRPKLEETRRMEWVVSIIQVTGHRSDGGFIYTFGGQSSQSAHFFWQGARPTPTQSPTPSPSPEP